MPDPALRQGPCELQLLAPQIRCIIEPLGILVVMHFRCSGGGMENWEAGVRIFRSPGIRYPLFQDSCAVPERCGKVSGKISVHIRHALELGRKFNPFPSDGEIECICDARGQVAADCPVIIIDVIIAVEVFVTDISRLDTVSHSD